METSILVIASAAELMIKGLFADVGLEMMATVLYALAGRFMSVELAIFLIIGHIHDMQSLKKTLDLAREALDKAGVDCALIGGLALGGRGVHRATMDVDLLVDGSKKEVAKSALQKAGFELRVETDEVLHFGGAGILDVLLANREPTRKMLARATVFERLDIKCVQVEDLIGLKIQAFTNDPQRAWQDKADIAALIKANPELDWNVVKEYADLFDQWPTIEAIRKT